MLYTFLTSALHKVSGELQDPVDNRLLYLQEVTIGRHKTEVSVLPDTRYRSVVLSTPMLVTVLI